MKISKNNVQQFIYAMKPCQVAKVNDVLYFADLETQMKKEMELKPSHLIRIKSYRYRGKVRKLLAFFCHLPEEDLNSVLQQVSDDRRHRVKVEEEIKKLRRES